MYSAGLDEKPQFASLLILIKHDLPIQYSLSLLVRQCIQDSYSTISSHSPLSIAEFFSVPGYLERLMHSFHSSQSCIHFPTREKQGQPLLTVPSQLGQSPLQHRQLNLQPKPHCLPNWRLCLHCSERYSPLSSNCWTHCSRTQSCLTLYWRLLMRLKSMRMQMR